MSKLTESQTITYMAIKDFIKSFGYSPTVREIADITGRSSSGTIFASMKILKRKGYIDYQENKQRTMIIKRGLYEKEDKQD